MAPKCPPVENPQKVHQEVMHFAPTWLPKVTFGRMFFEVFSTCFSDVFFGDIFRETLVICWLHLEPLGNTLGNFFDTLSMLSRGAKNCIPGEVC